MSLHEHCILCVAYLYNTYRISELLMYQWLAYSSVVYYGYNLLNFEDDRNVT